MTTDDTQPALRLVPPPRHDVTYPQIAGHPGAYAVRRGGTAEAIIHRDNAGAWLVMYGFDPHAGDDVAQWRRMSTLPAALDDGDAALLAAELVDAADTNIVGWAELLAAAMNAGGVVLAITRQHRPVGAGLYADCHGDSSPGPYWRNCPTVRLLAAEFGVEMPPTVV